MMSFGAGQEAVSPGSPVLLSHWPLGICCWAVGLKDRSPLHLRVPWTVLFLLVRSVLHCPGQAGCWSITPSHSSTVRSPLNLGPSASWDRWGFPWSRAGRSALTVGGRFHQIISC